MIDPVPDCISNHPDYYDPVYPYYNDFYIDGSYISVWLEKVFYPLHTIDDIRVIDVVNPISKTV